MRIAVTGGAGFIGSTLCRALADRDHEVRVLDDLSTGSVENLAATDVALTVGSITDADLVARWAEGADCLVHLAARASVPRSIAEPLATDAANVRGTLHVLEAARAAGAHVIVASSSSVYGATEASPKHEDLPPRPMSPYAVSKLATESYALAWQVSYGLPVLAYRFFNVYGPRQSAGHAYAAVVPAFVSAALKGEPITVHGDGEQSRDFTFVGSVADVLTRSIERRVTCDRPVNLAFGSSCTLNDLVAMIEQELGTTIERRAADPRVGDVRHSRADASRLLALFPDARPVPLREGLRSTVAWMRTSLTTDEPVAEEVGTGSSEGARHRRPCADGTS